VMKNRTRLLDAIVVLAAMAVADIAQSAPPPAEQVARSGPYVVKKAFKTEPYSVSKTVTHMSRDIDYKGLDLTSDADVARLEARVGHVAAEICGELDRRHPDWLHTSAGEEKNCTKTASESALADVRTAVAMARAKGQSAQNR